MLTKEQREKFRAWYKQDPATMIDEDVMALLDTCDALETERDTTEEINTELLHKVEALEAERDEYAQAWREIMDEPCSESDDRKHCTCVPALRKGIIELKALCLEAAEMIDALGIPPNMRERAWYVDFLLTKLRRAWKEE